MGMQDHLIFGIHVADRSRHAGQVQTVLTRYGCNIKTRVGLHHVDERVCDESGVILLETFGDEATCRQMWEELRQIPGIDVQQMLFTHA